ncbi:MAG: hypothetical protein B0W54_02790 [Cellvibrio sp. 79]|nr:MAG: hypothetical protein B0W54_02790 [Cellvibrio sp. 79]
MKRELDSMDINSLLKLFMEAKADTTTERVSEIAQAIELKSGFNILSASEREIKVLFERFKSDSSPMLVGLNVTPEKIKQIEDKALGKLNQKDS